MIHKASFCLATLVLFSLPAYAEKRMTSVLDRSSSGRLVRVNLGLASGLNQGEPVLFSAGDKKIAAGRVFRVDADSAIVAVLEKYGDETPGVDVSYELLYGEPFDEAANLPDFVADRDEELDNPGNERFLESDDRPTTPELDDDDYTPEVNLRPKLPEPRTYSPHNITVGVNLFRNRALEDASTAPGSGSASQKPSYTTYQGYSLRYAYTFRTHYWLHARTPALMSVEPSVGVFNFNQPISDNRVAQVRVIPLSLTLRYLVEVNKLFRLYPYFGMQYNFVGVSANQPSATGSGAGTSEQVAGVSDLGGSRILGGAGAQLVMSQDLDARIEAGTDGVMGGVVVKF